MIFLLICLNLPASAGAENAPWSFWAKTEKKDVPDSEYPGKPKIDPPAAIKKKREIHEDLREHVQEALAKADLTTEQGRRDWEQKKKEVKQKRMEELNRAKQEPLEKDRKIRAEVLKKEKKKSGVSEADSPKVPPPEIPEKDDEKKEASSAAAPV